RNERYMYSDKQLLNHRIACSRRAFHMVSSTVAIKVIERCSNIAHGRTRRTDSAAGSLDSPIESRKISLESADHLYLRKRHPQVQLPRVPARPRDPQSADLCHPDREAGPRRPWIARQR